MKKDFANYILGVCVGGLCGYLTAYIRLNKKHAREMAEVEKYYEDQIAKLKSDENKAESETEPETETSEKSESEVYEELVSKYRPNDIYESTKVERNDNLPSDFDDYEGKPVIIDPIQFSDMMDDIEDPNSVFFNGKSLEFLYMLRDGKLMNSENLRLISEDRIMEGDLIPADFVDHFGEYEDDSVYVYNSELNAVIEILAVDYTFDEYYEKETSRQRNSVW